MSLSFQSAQFDELARRRFESRLTRLIIEASPSAEGQIDTREGQQVLREQCQRAARYGLSAEIDVARYVVTAWLLGADFDERFPAMAEILNSPRLQPAQMADAIERVCTAVLAELAPGAT